MSEVLKIGIKGRHLEVPEGYRIMQESEIVNENCKVADLYKAEWQTPEKEDIGHRTENVGDYVICKIAL